MNPFSEPFCNSLVSSLLSLVCQCKGERVSKDICLVWCSFLSCGDLSAKQRQNTRQPFENPFFTSILGSDLLAFRLYPVTCVCTAPSVKTLSYLTLTVTLTLSLPFLLFAPSSSPCNPTTPSPATTPQRWPSAFTFHSQPSQVPLQGTIFSPVCSHCIFPLHVPQGNPLLFFTSFFLQAQGLVSAKFTHEVSSFLPHLLWAYAGWEQKLLGGTPSMG